MSSELGTHTGLTNLARQYAPVQPKRREDRKPEELDPRTAQKLPDMMNPFTHQDALVLSAEATAKQDGAEKRTLKWDTASQEERLRKETEAAYDNGQNLVLSLWHDWQASQAAAKLQKMDVPLEKIAEIRGEGLKNSREKHEMGVQRLARARVEMDVYGAG